MADITRLARFLNGKVRGIDLQTNTPVVLSIKIGGATNTELTKAILDRLVSLQNGSDVDATYHTHDGRYYTETELGSNTNGQGASLIGIEDASSQFTSTNVEGALDEALDAAQAAQSTIDGHLDGGVNKHDATEIDYERVDGSKVDIQATSDDVEAAITDLDDNKLGLTRAASTANGDGASLIGIEDSGGLITATTVEGALAENRGAIDDLESALGNPNATNMGTYTGTVITDNQSAKQNIQELETYAEQTRSLVQNFEFQNSALDYIVDNTAVPPTEVSGDRYVLSHDGGAPNAAWDGASAGDIVEFNGTSWVATSPTTGMMISIDDETTSLRQWGGSSWGQKFFESTTASTGLTKSGFDIQLADASLASGISVSSGVIAITLGTNSGLQFETGALSVLVDATGGIQRTASGLAIDFTDFDTDDITEGTTNLFHTTARARAAAVDDTAYAVSWDGVTDQAPSKNAVYDKIESLTGSDIAFSNTTSGMTATDVQAAIDEVEGRVDTLESAGGNESVIESMVAGEAMLANTLYCVRMAKGAETAGRVYLADKDASSADNFHVIGMVYSTSAIAAADTISVYKFGKFDLGAAHGLTIGEEHFLGAAGVVIDGGTSGANAPSTTDDAVVSVCIAREANILEVAIERRYVN